MERRTLLLSLFFLLVGMGKSEGKIRFVSWGGIGSVERVKAAAKIGVDAHRLPIGWPEERGSYDFGQFDRMILALHSAGIKVIVHFFNHGVPEWFWRKHPEAKLKNFKGETSDACGSIWNPYLKEAIKHNMATVLEHLKKKGLLPLVDGFEIGVGMEGQLSYTWDAFWAFDDYALRAYREFLRKRYRGSIKSLNKDWGTAYKSFKEIYPPKEWAYTKECSVFEEFYRESILNTAIEFSEVVLKFTKPKIWYWMSHFIKYPERYYSARFPLFYMQNLREMGRADVVQVSVVPGWQTKEEVAELRMLRLDVIGEIYITPTPEEQREHARLAKELGCDGFFVGTLENLFDEKGNPTPTGLETERIIKAWLKGEPF